MFHPQKKSGTLFLSCFRIYYAYSQSNSNPNTLTHTHTHTHTHTRKALHGAVTCIIFQGEVSGFQWLYLRLWSGCVDFLSYCVSATRFHTAPVYRSTNVHRVITTDPTTLNIFSIHIYFILK